MILWPRLPLARAKVLAAGYNNLTTEELELAPMWTKPSARLYAPTGGLPVDQKRLREFRQSLHSTAATAGYPRRSDRRAKAAFDRSTMELLVDAALPFGECLRPEMWAWLTVILVPHIVKWRWVDTSGAVTIERFAGAVVRNALGRLWYEGISLDRGKQAPDRWLLSDCFTADQSVALLERPTLAANRKVCQSVARVWAALPAKKRREEVFREAMKALVVRAGIQRLDVLESQDLDEVVHDGFAITLHRLQIAGT